MGIIRVVEELLLQKPGSIIVLNGLLPRSYIGRNGFLIEGSQTSPTKYTIKNPPMLWRDIQAINRQLEAYSKKRDNLVFVDFTDLFLVDPTAPDDKLQIDVNLMGDYLHPSALGYKLWGDEIVKTLKTLNRSTM